MSTMDDLTAWLEQILDEDEDEACREKYADLEGPLGPRHIFADIAAKRAIIALHRVEGYAEIGNGGIVHRRERYCAVCATREVAGDLEADDWPCTTVRLLALPHANRPGYQEAWRPE